MAGFRRRRSRGFSRGVPRSEGVRRQRHARMFEKGQTHAARVRPRSRDESRSSYDAGYSAGQRDASRGARSWPDDYRGHSKASSLGWRRRKRKGGKARGRGRRDVSLTPVRDMSTRRQARSWPDDFRGHSRASSLGWKRRKRGRKKARGSSRGRDFERDMNRSRGRASSGGSRSWPDDYRGHSLASTKGWRRRKKSSGRRAKISAVDRALAATRRRRGGTRRGRDY